MNVVHKVAVLFHAQDRLSNRMQAIHGKFANLSKAQGDYAKSLKNLERMEDSAIKMVQRHEKAESSASVARMRMRQQELTMIARVAEAERTFEAKREAGAVAYSDRQRMREENQTRIQQDYQARREALSRRFRENEERAADAHADRLRTIDRTLRRHTNSTNVLQTQFNRLGPSRAPLAELQEYRNRLDTARGRAMTTAAGGLTGMDAANAAQDAARPFNRQISNLDKAINEERKRVDLAEKLTQAETKGRELTTDRTRLVERHNATITRLQAAETRGLDDLSTKERQVAETKFAADNQALANIGAKNKANAEAHDAQMGRLRFQADFEDGLRDERTRQLNEEHRLRRVAAEDTERQYKLEQQMLQVQEDRQRKAQVYHDRAWQGAGMVLGAGYAGSSAVHIVGNIAEAGVAQQRAMQQLEAMGIHGATLGSVIKANRDEAGLNKGVSFVDSVNSFKLLHAVLGGSKAVLGDKLDDVTVLNRVNQFKAASHTTFGLSDVATDYAIRAAELGSSSNTATGKVRSHEERTQNFLSRLELINQAFSATGGTLKTKELFDSLKTMQASKFNLSDDGFLRLAFVMQELGGGRTGTAMNSLMTNMLMGQQTGYKNMGMAKLGLINAKDKSIEFTKDKKGIKSFNPLTAFKEGALLAADPVKWTKDVFMPAIQAAMKKDGMAFNEKNAELYLTKNIMGTAGRQTTQGLLALMFRQSQRIEDDFQRAKEAEKIQERFKKSQEQFAFQTRQFVIESENLKAALAEGVLPVIGELIKKATPVMRGLADSAKANPAAVGAVTGAALSAMLGGAALGVGYMVNSYMGMAALAKMGSAMTPVIAGAAGTGLAAGAASDRAKTGANRFAGMVSKATQAALVLALGVAAYEFGKNIRAALDQNRDFNETDEGWQQGMAERFGPDLYDPLGSFGRQGEKDAKAWGLLGRNLGHFVRGEPFEKEQKPGAAPPRTEQYGPHRPGGTANAPYMEGEMPHTLTVRIVAEGDGDKNMRAATKTGTTLADELKRVFPTVSQFDTSGAFGALPPGVTRK